MRLDGGNGRVEGTGAYRKPGAGPVPNEGAVYIVAGSSGKVSAVGAHPAMFAAWSELGSLVLDVDGPNLDASFVTATGIVRDWFRITKTDATCAPAPREDCRAPQRASLIMRQRDSARSSLLAWNWLKGEVTTAADFGDPTGTTDYALCLYANGVFAGEINAPASPATWTMTKRGARFRNRSGSESGARKITLMSGAAGRASVRVRAGGESLPRFDLPMSTPFTLQLVQAASAPCWSSTFAADQLRRNDADRVVARFP